MRSLDSRPGPRPERSKGSWPHAAMVNRIRELERQLRRMARQVTEAAALLRLSRQAPKAVVGGRGRHHGPAVRARICSLVDEAVARGARIASACQLLGISVRTLQRWRQPWLAEDRRVGAHRPPANRLSEQERLQVLELLHAEPYRGLSPRQLVPRLADQGRYLASESTFYRLLRRERWCRLRTRARHSPEPPKHCWVAERPNQVWSWDISALKGPERGAFLYLYLVVDVFSRRIMGWSIHPEEAAGHASELILRACAENGVEPAGLVLHSDNGRPMRGAALLSTLRHLGIVASFSRPRVPDDNPFSEALFRTLKQRPSYPGQTFASLEEARAWVARFATWYNSEHLHSGIRFVTPDDRHFGREALVMARRRAIYGDAMRSAAARWTGPMRTWLPAGPVRLRAGRSDANPLFSWGARQPG
ncbi:IS5 family transposase orfB [Corallococcus coralloides DSM 2259]|uniref:IS5 family transposase orfB n=2 Tax=Corallococcus coralloides TaxID=184914 RepID=H8N2A8_CORCM|nr:IS3 family transposase [Corallococcus coralloides]AFE09607.1 IS5 family transposase orfB [Corallococcus coralloides DSM 2259]